MMPGRRTREKAELTSALCRKSNSAHVPTERADSPYERPAELAAVRCERERERERERGRETKRERARVWPPTDGAGIMPGAVRVS